MNHLNIFVAGKPMVSIPLVSPSAVKATEGLQPYVKDGTFVIVEGKKRMVV